MDTNLQIKHTNTGLSTSDDFLYLKNLFDLDFYFQFADTIELSRQIKNNNFIYSKKQKDMDSFSENTISLQTFLQGSTVKVSFEGLLDPSSNGAINPFLGGVNKLICGYDSNNNSLRMKDAIPVPEVQLRLNIWLLTLKNQRRI